MLGVRSSEGRKGLRVAGGVVDSRGEASDASGTDKSAVDLWDVESVEEGGESMVADEYSDDDDGLAARGGKRYDPSCRSASAATSCLPLDAVRGAKNSRSSSSARVPLRLSLLRIGGAPILGRLVGTASLYAGGLGRR